MYFDLLWPLSSPRLEINFSFLKNVGSSRLDVYSSTVRLGRLHPGLIFGLGARFGQDWPRSRVRLNIKYSAKIANLGQI